MGSDCINSWPLFIILLSYGFSVVHWLDWNCESEDMKRLLCCIFANIYSSVISDGLIWDYGDTMCHLNTYKAVYLRKQKTNLFFFFLKHRLFHHLHNNPKRTDLQHTQMVSVSKYESGWSWTKVNDWSWPWAVINRHLFDYMYQLPPHRLQQFLRNLQFKHFPIQKQKGPNLTLL